eukprot:CAMPEP_0184989994 /NCGR_PEP_ID=MMETSP1098-20130426/30608_1 /TAXON_ID=89044 /ORGANISM="Spumella elongata, Strain CCAP 955/1" /LENGTH=278 /DNA_ID=CAMNT_0027515111 /DNA_START=36 /DNA_END=868 /DNA_ORIENTATION=-
MRSSSSAGGKRPHAQKHVLAVPNVGDEEFDDVISDNAQYGRIQFWDLKYAEEHEAFEWYYGYGSFRETIRDNIPLEGNVMIAGCGSSNMIGDMADDGYERLVAADLSRVVMTQLKYRYQDYPQISFFQGTLTDTDLPEGSFDAIVDKGLFDALLCTQTGALTVAQYVYEAERLLNDTGVFIIISYGNPEQRLPFLEQHDIDVPRYTPWMVEVQALLKPKEFPEEELDSADPNSYYFVYIITKRIEMVMKKNVKLGRLNKKQMKALQPTRRRAPNLKPT